MRLQKLNDGFERHYAPETYLSKSESLALLHLPNTLYVIVFDFAFIVLMWFIAYHFRLFCIVFNRTLATFDILRFARYAQFRSATCCFYARHGADLLGLQAGLRVGLG